MHMQSQDGMRCRCPHHIFSMILSGVIFVFTIIFFYIALKAKPVLGFGPEFYFESAILVALVSWGTKHCGCCRKMWMAKSGMCGNKACSDCGDKNCGGTCKMENNKMTCDHKDCTCGHNNCTSCK